VPFKAWKAENSSLHVQKRNAVLLGLAAGLAALAVLTLLPNYRFINQFGLVRCLVCGEMNTLDVIHNVLLFVPVGLLLFALTGRPVVAILSACVVSLGIEGLQFGLLPSRDPAVLDVATNTAGAALGTGLGIGWRARRRRPAIPTIKLGMCALLVPFAVISASSVLLRPAVAPPETLYGQWAPRRPNFEPWPGKVVGLDVGGVAVPHGEVPDQAALRVAWERGGPARVTVQGPLTDGPRPSLLARLVAVNDEVFMVAATSKVLIVRTRMVASDLGLRPLLWQVPIAPVGAGPFVIEAGIGKQAAEAWASLEGPSGASATTLPFDASLGWALLLPFELPLGWWRHLISALWMAVLWLPVGLLSGWRPHHRRAVAVSGAIAAFVLCLGIVPAALGAAPIHWHAWVGGLIGLVAGWRVAVRASRGPA
jgi:VanZ family protein